MRFCMTILLAQFATTAMSWATDPVQQPRGEPIVGRAPQRRLFVYSAKGVGSGPNGGGATSWPRPAARIRATSGESPATGYPFKESYMADNDLALARVVQFLSRNPYWKNMLIIVTEDDPQGGRDHIDAHRSLLLLISPHVKKGSVSSTLLSFGSIMKVIFTLLDLPCLNHFDATAAMPHDCFSDQPDSTPYAPQPVDKRLFDPAKALKPFDRGFDWSKLLDSPVMDDPKDMQRGFQQEDRRSQAHQLPEKSVVQAVSGYNSWPMIQAIGEKLVCVYSRGTAHTIDEDARAVYARTSRDNGKTWTTETVVANTPSYGEVAVGKGLDSTGAMLLWVRRIGPVWNHDLYRTTDGVTFTRLATPQLAVPPMQITDIFAVPKVGLMALWFAGRYDDSPSHSWGTLTSRDNGATWVQRTVESELTKSQWPTEPSAVYLGDGTILAVARTETGGTSQFQLVSIDYGATWARKQTNINDVTASTPSLILDPETGLLSNYYYHRGKGILRRRVADPDGVFSNPLNWPASEEVAAGSPVTFDAGNANATAIGGTHFVAFYSGKAPDTAILVSVLPAPTAGNSVSRSSRPGGPRN